MPSAFTEEQKVNRNHLNVEFVNEYREEEQYPQNKDFMNPTSN